MYVFSGDPLVIDYTLENGRRWYGALAVFLEDSLVPVDRARSRERSASPLGVFFARVAGQRSCAAVRWEALRSPRRKATASIGFVIWM